jgi:hypothetical protein
VTFVLALPPVEKADEISTLLVRQGSECVVQHHICACRS